MTDEMKPPKIQLVHRRLGPGKKALAERRAMLTGFGNETNPKWRSYYERYRKHFVEFCAGMVEKNPRDMNPGLYWDAAEQDATHPLHEAIVTVLADPERAKTFEAAVHKETLLWRDAHKQEIEADLDEWIRNNDP